MFRCQVYSKYIIKLFDFLFFSEAIAGYGTSVSLPQISFASTADDLSDTDTYSYFSRTCPSDYSQGTMLANTLNYFGIKPYVTGMLMLRFIFV